MRSKYFFLFFFLSLISISCVSAQPTFQVGTFESGLRIEYPPIQYLQLNENFTFNFHVFNSTNGVLMTNESGVNCTFHLYDHIGSTIYTLDNVPFEDGDFVAFVGGGNLSNSEEYGYIMQCESGSAGGYVAVSLIVNPTGEEQSTAKAVFYIGILSVLLIFFLIVVYGFVTSEELWTKTANLGVCYLLLIAISFIAWNMAANFMTSSTFVIGFLRIVFLVFIIGFFPFLLGLFAYGVYMMLQIEEIKELQNKGYTLEEATEKVQNRRNSKR